MDSTRARVPAALPVGFAPFGVGCAVGGVPARQPVDGVADIVGAVPGAFRYDLGVPGAPDGVAFGSLPPRRIALALDGLPASDLFTDRPAFELLPLDALAPLGLASRYGAPAGVVVNLRAYAASIPITELRYRAGGNGIQFISATHAQTRRPGFVRALGGDRARLQALFHVSGRKADGDFAGTDVSGFQVIGRVGIALPALSLEITERYGRDRSGASRGVAPVGAFDTVFDPDAALVLDPNAERITVRNDLAATLRLPLFGTPLAATAWWTAETFRYTNPALVTDTTEAQGERFGAALAQPFRVGPHRFGLRAEVWLDRVESSAALPGGDNATLHLTATDSVAVAGFGLGLEVGLHRGPDAAFPSASVRLERALGAARFYASAEAAGAVVGPVERSGFGALARADGAVDERTLALAAGFDAALGPFDVGMDARALQRTDPRLLLATLDTTGAFVTAAFMTAEGAFRSATGTLRIGWRDRARRGLYARTSASAHAFLDADTPERERAADAVPPLWGEARLGFRALGLFDGNLDLDLAVRGRGWTAFRGRLLHAPTALFALAPLDARPVDAGGTLGAVAEAAIGGGRATVFVGYENALAGRATAGSYIVPVYPLPEPRLRFGVFWLLPN